MDGWDTADFEKNPIVFYGHDYRGSNVKFPIGTATVTKDVTNRRLLPSGSWKCCSKRPRRLWIPGQPDRAVVHYSARVFVADLIPLLRANMTVIATGATILDGLNGSPVRIPKQASPKSLFE